MTRHGFVTQCQELAANFKTLPLAQEIELIVTSPLRRTLQTATQGLGWLIDRGVPVQLRAEWQENSAKPCDTGTAPSKMKDEWAMYDWSSVDPVFPSKTGLYEFTEEALINRGVAARRWLRNRPEKVIAVVSHAGFLRVGVSYRRYENADYRIFDFTEGDEELGGGLVEREETASRGGGMGKSDKGVFGFNDDDRKNIARAHTEVQKSIPDEQPST